VVGDETIGASNLPCWELEKMMLKVDVRSSVPVFPGR